MTRAWQLIVVLAGCSRSHGNDDITFPPGTDAGADDGGSNAPPRVDAGPPPRRDARPTLSCDGLRPLDPAAIHFDADPSAAMGLGSDGAFFYLAHRHGDPSPCDSPCPATLTFGRVGAPGLQPVYWQRFDAPTHVDDGARRAVVWAQGDGVVRWQIRPREDELWRPDGELAIPEGVEVRGVAPASNGRVDVVMHDGVRARGGFAGLRVVQVDATGDGAEERRCRTCSG